jgi:hypothetical protein
LVSVREVIDARWTKQYLAGRARGYLRGNVTLADVSAAVRLALRRDLPVTEVDEVLTEFGLRWDAPTGAVVPSAD